MPKNDWILHLMANCETILRKLHSILISNTNYNVQQFKGSAVFTHQQMKQLNGKEAKAINLNELIISKKLGQGRYGKVYLGTWNSMTVAIKEIQKEIPKVIEKEKDMMVLLSAGASPSAHIVKLLAFAETPAAIHLVMDYMPKGSLGSLIKDAPKSLSNKALYKIMSHVSSAVAYMHSKQILHRDIKCDNVLLEERNGQLQAKLADFGFAISSDAIQQSVCGSPLWMAPEIFNGKQATKQSDIYSFGMTLYEAFAWQEPFEEMASSTTTLDEFKLLLKLNMRPSIPKDCPSGIKTMITLCWKTDPICRPTTEKLVEKFGTNGDTFFIEDEIISLIREQLLTIQTKWKTELAKLNEILNENSSNTEKIQVALTKMIDFFCKKCVKYDNKLTLFRTKLNPIELLNNEEQQHRLTRSIGLILKTILQNQKMVQYVKDKCLIDIEQQINYTFNNMKRTQNYVQLNLNKVRYF